MSDEPIWIVTRDDKETVDGGKGWRDDLGRKIAVLKPQPIDPDKLKQEWKWTMQIVGQLIQQAEQEAGGSFGMQLDEVTLAVEINGKGQVTLLGACSSEASGKGAITLKFKRAESKRDGE
ncbi:MAG: hypothetical protein IGS49_04570 [Chlorogloeopsis fritschii C42_A2020_084]|uniref:Pepco domain-containing protein n=1 Tax=Chlorogloeopsis fritschii TaxID=1124 RepID=UPI001A09A503|nr:hypothetical protein [Chlorogloeopsis fritschii]MBF2004744.1 hypothetical protein [Chlorogloeopsis fritschii C42_A2020_084]